MKKILTGTILTILLSFALVSTTLGATTRTETGVIITADYIKNYWEVMDTSGNIWFFSNGEDLECGDLVKVTFDTVNTRSIYDDEIIRVFCIGYVENINRFLE